MSDLIAQNIRWVKIDGQPTQMRMAEYDKLSKEPNVLAYVDKQGYPCIDHIKQVEQPTPKIETLPPVDELLSSSQKPIVQETKPDLSPNIVKDNSNYTGHRPKGLHYHYKAGKQTDLLEWEEIDKRIKAAYLNLEQRVYFVLTMFVGARKEEVLELVVDSLKYNDTTLYVDIGKRLKGSESTKPIPIDRTMPYVDDIIVFHAQRSMLKPAKKMIIRFGKIYTGVKKGKDRIPVWSRVEKTDRWLFRNISRGTAINIFKRVLGPEFYPHYGRLWSLSAIGRSHEGNIVMLKSRSGIKSTQVLNDYLGQSEEELNKSKDALTNIVGKVPNISTEPETKTSS